MTTRPITNATYAYIQALTPGTRFTLGSAPQMYEVITVTAATVYASRIPHGPRRNAAIGQRRWPSIRTTQETP